MTILDLCGGTGAWSKPYADAGYDVRVVDWMDGEDVRMFEWASKVDEIRGILAAPPCTEFSFAKHFHGEGNYYHDFLGGLSVVDACLRMVATIRPQWWALENPVGYLKRWLGEPDYMFEPWWFGDEYQKRTCLWGEFGTPVRIVSEPPPGLKKFSLLKSREIFPEHYGKLSRQVRRAITPPGFAQAFFEANP